MKSVLVHDEKQPEETSTSEESAWCLPRNLATRSRAMCERRGRLCRVVEVVLVVAAVSHFQVIRVFQKCVPYLDPQLQHKQRKLCGISRVAPENSSAKRAIWGARSRGPASEPASERTNMLEDETDLSNSFPPWFGSFSRELASLRLRDVGSLSMAGTVSSRARALVPRLRLVGCMHVQVHIWIPSAFQEQNTALNLNF